MSKTYIFGHKKPDTDSVTAAISLSYLKNKLGMDTEPRVLGSINNETSFVLNYFNIPKPLYLNDVKLQIKDIEYSKDCFLNETNSIYDGYTTLYERNFSNIPVTDKNNKFLGIVSLKHIAKELVQGELESLCTSYSNLVSTLKAKEILRFDEEITGTVVFAGYRSTTFMENYEIKDDTILVVGDRDHIIDYALKSNPKMIVLVGDHDLSSEALKIAKEKKVNVLKTSSNSFVTSKLISLSTSIKSLITTDNIIVLKENDSVNEFLEVASKQKFSNYPVINDKNECLGVLRMADIYKKHPKKVILVDHNEAEQSVNNLEEAEIIEIVDHHKIGTIGTNVPINFRNMTVGCTSTIIYNLYIENNVKIPREIAGLMLSAILSDTLMFTSPTTTELDKVVAKELEKIAKVDMDAYGKEMFKAGSSLEGKSKLDLLYGDFKNFTIKDKKVGIGQVSTMDAEPFLKDKQEFIDLINKEVKENGYYALGLFVTDILKGGSYIFFNDSAKEIFINAFDLEELHQGTFFPGIISRKKQTVPFVVKALERL